MYYLNPLKSKKNNQIKQASFLKLKSGGGFTLIEMMVVVIVFTLLIGTGLGLFVSSLKAQRQSLATHEVLNQTSYLIEYMSRALRMAKKDISGNCLTTAGAKSNYETGTNRIRFLNYDDKCQEFFLEGGQIKEQKSTDDTELNFGLALPLTSSGLQIVSFNIKLSGQQQPPVDLLQPRLTIFFAIQGREQSEIKIQTTISQRNPDTTK